MLSRPGWQGSGFSNEAWWKRAIFYEVRDNATDFKALAARLDAIQSTGLDALIVTPPPLPQQSSASAEQAIASQAELDSFDAFVRQATGRGIRVLVALPATRADDALTGQARFWLTRGVAGLRLEIPASTAPADRDAIAASIRTLAAGFTGQRVILTDSAPATDAPPAAKRPARSAQARAASQLTVEPLAAESTTAAAIRPQLERAFAAPETLLDARTPAGSEQLAQVFATLALATNSAAIADPAQPLVLPASVPLPEPEDDSVKPAAAPRPAQPPPGVYLPYTPYTPPPPPKKKAAAPPAAPADPLTAWYGRLAAFHHSNVALRTGTRIALDLDEQNVLAWVLRPPSPTLQNPPLVALCNLSGAPVTLSLTEPIKKLGLRGFFLRTLLRSDDAMGAQDLGAVKLAPYGVFIGELRR